MALSCCPFGAYFISCSAASTDAERNVSQHDPAVPADLLGFDGLVSRRLPDHAMGVDAALVGKRHLADNCLVDRQRHAREAGHKGRKMVDLSFLMPVG